MKKLDSDDKYITHIVEDDLSQIHVPNLDDVWINIESNLKKKKTNSYRGLIAVAVIAIIIFVGSGLNSEGYANYFRNLKFIITRTDKSTEINMNNKTPGEIDETFEGDNFNSDEPKEFEFTLDVAKTVSTFPLGELSYIPEGYLLEKVILKQFDTKTLDVRYEYKLKGDIIEFIQEPIRGEHSVSMKINPGAGKIIEKIDKGYKYYIIKYNDEKIEIIWDKAEIKYTLKGYLVEEDMLKMAHSME